MLHIEGQDFFKRMIGRFPQFFKGKKVLEIGSLDINGNNHYLLDSCPYIGIDRQSGQNVDVVVEPHLYDAPDRSFDTVISTGVLGGYSEYRKTIQNVIRMLNENGAFLFTCQGLTDHNILAIEGFKAVFPDGIFEILGDHLFFFGIKGGIRNYFKWNFNVVNVVAGPNDFTDHIFVVDAWPDTPEKENDLVECIKRLREFQAIKILLVAHYAIKPQIQKLVDYYLYDGNNPLLLNEEFHKYRIDSTAVSSLGDFYMYSSLPFHHDYAIWTSMQNAFNFCKLLGKNFIHFMEYDNIIDTFQFKQAFVEPLSYRDAVLYEYENDSLKQPEPYCGTFIFSIRTDVAINTVSQIKSKEEYFSNKSNNWQLEKTFLRCLKNITSNIEKTKYIANNNEINTQAVWNRDHILRDGLKFQIYLGVDKSDTLWCQLISGFWTEKANKDYLLEIKYADSAQFVNLKAGEMSFINLGKYIKGSTVEARYQGKGVFKEFLNTSSEEFRKFNLVTLDNNKKDVEVNYNYINGVFFEIAEDTDHKFKVVFTDKKQNKEVYSSDITGRCWSRPSMKYFVDWRISLYDMFGKLVKEIDLDLSGKRVYIAFESRSLGDNLAWIPYVEEFRKKHKCIMICSTFWNDMFRDGYPEIEFVYPSTVVYDIIAMYSIGWFYREDNNINSELNPSDFRLGPLQKTSADILGLDYQEIRPKIKYKKKNRLKKVGLGINSTAQAKYWKLTNW